MDPNPIMKFCDAAESGRLRTGVSDLGNRATRVTSAPFAAAPRRTRKTARRGSGAIAVRQSNSNPDVAPV